ncbi:MAG: phage holin family protein [Rikenellaceae bacterium]|nr:phage holin family protein [Rikenellaceae bacterium]
MGGFERLISGVICALGALLLPARPLIICVGVFVLIDFVIGVAASRTRARRVGDEWRFESRKAWRTVYKAVFAMTGICMAWTLDSLVLDFAHLNLAKVFTGFVCGVEFWSYLENAADISNHPMFSALRNLMKGRIGKGLNINEKE